MLKWKKTILLCLSLSLFPLPLYAFTIKDIEIEKPTVHQLRTFLQPLLSVGQNLERQNQLVDGMIEKINRIYERQGGLGSNNRVWMNTSIHFSETARLYGEFLNDYKNLILAQKDYFTYSEDVARVLAEPSIPGERFITRRNLAVSNQILQKNIINKLGYTPTVIPNDFAYSIMLKQFHEDFSKNLQLSETEKLFKSWQETAFTSVRHNETERRVIRSNVSKISLETQNVESYKNDLEKRLNDFKIEISEDYSWEEIQKAEKELEKIRSSFLNNHQKLTSATPFERLSFHSKIKFLVSEISESIKDAQTKIEEKRLERLRKAESSGSTSRGSTKRKANSSNDIARKR